MNQVFCSKLEIVSRNKFRLIRCDKKKYLCHPVIASYVPDIPDINDLLPLKHGVLSLSPGQRCLVGKEKINFTANYLVSNGTEALTIISTLPENSTCSLHRNRADNLSTQACDPVYLSL